MQNFFFCFFTFNFLALRFLYRYTINVFNEVIKNNVYLKVFKGLHLTIIRLEMILFHNLYSLRDFSENSLNDAKNRLVRLKDAE
jgi:O-succinylbenzoate synthase